MMMSHKEVAVPALVLLDDRIRSTERSADLATIARYLVEAVAADEITVAEAELAIVDRTHDPNVLRAAAAVCDPDAGAARLLRRVLRRCHWAA
jgi:hypothetical protein